MTEHPVRKNLRLKSWDYTSGGTYFITICTKDRRHTLSAIVGGDAYIAPQIRLTPLGQLAEHYLSSIPGMIKFVVMPNHVHFLVTLENGPMRASAPTLTNVVRSFKTLVTKAWGAPESGSGATTTTSSAIPMISKPFGPISTRTR